MSSNSPHPSTGLRIRLLQGPRCHTGVVIDLSGEAALHFTGDELPLLAIGSMAEVEFSGQGETSIETVGMVTYRRELGDGREYHLRLPVRVLAQLKAIMARNKSPRIEPAPASCVLVQLVNDEGALEPVTVADLSISDVAVLIPKGHEEHYLSLDDTLLHLHLPGWSQITVSGRIVHRTLEAERVKLGISFCLEESPGREEIEQAISRAVLHRQVEALHSIALHRHAR